MPLILAALVVGLLLPVQAGVNAQLRLTMGHPLTTAFVSFLVGTLALGGLLLVLRLPVPPRSALAAAPAWHWVGGLLGAVYIVAAVMLAPRLGAATMIASIVAGQMLASLIIDHRGWIGFAQRTASPGRILGVALVIIGVLLVRRPG